MSRKTGTSMIQTWFFAPTLCRTLSGNKHDSKLVFCVNPLMHSACFVNLQCVESEPWLNFVMANLTLTNSYEITKQRILPGSNAETADKEPLCHRAIYRSSRKTCINHSYFFVFQVSEKNCQTPCESFPFWLKLQICIKQQYHRVSPHEWTYLGTHQSWVMSSDFWTAYYLLNLHN